MLNYFESTAKIIDIIKSGWAAKFPSLKLVFADGEKVDLDTVGSSFVRVTVEVDLETQESIDSKPIDSFYGLVTFQIFAKSGSGGRSSMKVMDTLRSWLGFMHIEGTLHLECPKPGAVVEKSGWVSRDLLIPFSFWQ